MKLIIKNALAILPEGYKKTDLFIDGDTIVSIGEAPAGFKADRILEAENKLLVPGFVNAHTHIYMTCMRNRADDLNFMKWLFDTVVPMENTLTDEDSYWGTQLGCMEMLMGGVTSICDMHMFPMATPKALSDAGIRAVVTRGLQGGADSWDAGMKRISQALEEAQAYKDAPTLSFRLAPHAPYTCDDKYLAHIAEVATEKKMGLNVHLSESADEQKTIRERYGCTPAELMDRCGILRRDTLCAHCVYLSESDMDTFAKKGVSVAHNPASNMKLGNGFAPVDIMLQKGINVALGTDGCCSNNNQSMLREMGLAGLIHKGVRCEATTVTAAEVFDMATINGAKALGLENVGEIKVGSKADLSLFDLDFPGFFPLGDPKSALVYSNAGLRAETVIVNGNILLDRGEFTTIDVERVKYEINRIQTQLDRAY